MGFWDFFKKLKEKKEEEVKVEKISQSQLSSWVENKKQEIQGGKEKFLRQIQTRLSGLISDLQEKIFVLKQVNVDEKKAEDKVKLIVKENRDNYVHYLEKLLEKIKEINNENRGDVVEKIKSTFEDFNKRSKASYEKATFLIGKEIGNIKDSIRKFFRELDKTVKGNQEIIDNLKLINSVEEKINKLDEAKKAKSEIERDIQDYDKKIHEIEQNIQNKKQEIEKITSSEEFMQEKQKKEDLEAKKKQLEQDIETLREIIDFKALAGFYHSFEKEMAIVKSYKENFKQNFKKAQGNDILTLLKDAKLQTPEIMNKIQGIQEKQKETESTEIQDLGISKIEQEITKLNSDVQNINEKKLTEEKKLKKLEGNIEGIISSIKGQLLKINVEIM